jgi:hypothetical protein
LTTVVGLPSPPFGEGRFLVHTRRGAFIVDPPSGVRVHREMEDFEDDEDDEPGKSKSSPRPAPSGPRAVVFDGQVVVARGKKLIRLKLTEAGLLPDGEMKLDQKAAAMREQDRRLYLVGSKKKNPSMTVVVLDGTMKEAGAHDVGAWVSRADDGLVRVRYRDDAGLLELARVMP